MSSHLISEEIGYRILPRVSRDALPFSGTWDNLTKLRNDAAETFDNLIILAS